MDKSLDKAAGVTANMRNNLGSKTIHPSNYAYNLTNYNGGKKRKSKKSKKTKGGWKSKKSKTSKKSKK